MSSIPFAKFHALGNHFIFIDNREECYDLTNPKLARSMYDVKTGIGADCLLEIRNCRHGAHKNCAFELVHYQCDGTIDTLCGNGSRCAVKYACDLGIIPSDEEITFCGFDGEHRGFFDAKTGLVHVRMRDVDSITKYDFDNYYVFTGAPSHVVYVEAVKDCNVPVLGEQICHRYPEGTNVMFAEMDMFAEEIKMRSFQRRNKQEIWSCGTGTVGVALTSHFRKNKFTGPTKFLYELKANLGTLQIYAHQEDKMSLFKNGDIYLFN